MQEIYPVLEEAEMIVLASPTTITALPAASMRHQLHLCLG